MLILPKSPKALSVVQVPGGRYAYYAVKVYTVKPRQRDGVVTWRAGKRVSEDFRSEDLTWREAAEFAQEMGLPVVGVSHGYPLTEDLARELGWWRD